MSWEHITEDQGKIIMSICDKFRDDGKKDWNCPGCPLHNVCDANFDELPADEPERTRVFETRLYEAAKEYIQKENKYD